MEKKKCLLCRDRIANKTNSHLVPSFIVANVCSYDDSGKRDKEVMFTITPQKTKLYTGRNIPDTKIEEIIDTETLTDERIDTELSANTVSMDYIFCSECEKSIGAVLETPYSAYIKGGKTISPDISFFFWISVVWRMSISKRFGFELPIELETKLGILLNQYIILKENGETQYNLNQFIKEVKIYYKILRCPSFLPKNSGFIGAIYKKEDKILSLNLGDILVCFPFNGYIPEDYNFFGAEKAFIDAKNNYGIEPEHIFEVSDVFMNTLNSNFIKTIAHDRAMYYWKIANVVWKKLGLKGTMPVEIFQHCMDSLLSEQKKIGDRHTYNNIVKVLGQTLCDFGILSQ